MLSCHHEAQLRTTKPSAATMTMKRLRSDQAMIGVSMQVSVNRLLVAASDPLLEQLRKQGKAARGGNFFACLHATALDDVAIAEAGVNGPDGEALVVRCADKDHTAAAVRLQRFAGNHQGFRLFAYEDAPDAEVVGTEPAVGVVEFRMNLDATSLFVHFRADMTHLGGDAGEI